MSDDAAVGEAAVDDSCIIKEDKGWYFSGQVVGDWGGSCEVVEVAGFPEVDVGHERPWLS